MLWEKKWIFLWSWIVWQLEDIVCYIWPDFYGWDLLSVFSWHDYWSYCCSSISYHLSYVNWPSLHKSWFVACLQFALLCCMTLSHLHATLVSDTSWYMFLLPFEASKVNVFYYIIIFRTGRKKEKPITVHACPTLWKSSNLLFVLKHLLVDLKMKLPWYLKKNLLFLEHVWLKSVICLFTLP